MWFKVLAHSTLSTQSFDFYWIKFVNLRQQLKKIRSSDLLLIICGAKALKLKSLKV